MGSQIELLKDNRENYKKKVKIIEKQLRNDKLSEKKKMFIKRCKGLITNKEWKECRNNRFLKKNLINIMNGRNGL